eukprot:jgi/Chrzof1/6884/Cz02g02030.t1
MMVEGELMSMAKPMNPWNGTQLPVGVPLPNDPYATEPPHVDTLITRTEKPYTAEPPQDKLVEAGLITPVELFYVRNHLPAPILTSDTYQLRVEGPGLREGPVTLSLEDLIANFKHHTVVATVQCAGNRRNDMRRLKEVKGGPWEAGAIGTAEWHGVLLRDLLEYAGADLHKLEHGSSPDGVQHVHFEGYDNAGPDSHFAVSIPLSKAVHPTGDVLLALKMNGQPLPPQHGYPVRVIVPGYAGVRNVKWLKTIRLSAEECQSHWQQSDYKMLPPYMDFQMKADWKSVPAMQAMPVQSAMCKPTDGQQVTPHAGSHVHVSGYAWSGGGRRVIRLEVTADHGKTWTSAKLNSLPQEYDRCWAWILWTAEVPVSGSTYRSTETASSSLSAGISRLLAPAGGDDASYDDDNDPQTIAANTGQDPMEVQQQMMMETTTNHQQAANQNSKPDQQGAGNKPEPAGAACSGELQEAVAEGEGGSSKPQKEVELCCKATDDSYNTQPDHMGAIWNLRGVGNNAWHNIKIKIA